MCAPGGARALEEAAEPADLSRILKLEVPIIVRLAERTMKVSEVLDIAPGRIIELPKDADAELDLLVNNRPIGTGSAVKIGENFGVRIAFIGDLQQRVEAMSDAPKETDSEADEAAELAAQFLAGQAEAA